MSNTKLTTIEFHGSTLTAIVGSTPYATLVGVKPIIEGMGLNWPSQSKRIRRHPVLESCVVIMAIQLPGDMQVREHVFLPLGLLNLWLATIQPGKITDGGTGDAIVEYQMLCAKKLYKAWFPQVNQVADELSPKLLPILEEVVKGIKEAFAEFDARIMRMPAATEARTSQHLAVVQEGTIRNMAEVKSRLALHTDEAMAKASHGTDASHGLHHYRTMVSILSSLGVTAEMKRRALAWRCAVRIRSWCDKANRKDGYRYVAIDEETGYYCYHDDAVRDWMEFEGAKIIKTHLGALKGKEVLRLIPGED